MEIIRFAESLVNDEVLMTAAEGKGTRKLIYYEMTWRACLDQA